MKGKHKSIEDEKAILEFNNLAKAGRDHSENIPTPARLKKDKEENKSYESSSKISLFPAYHTDNKDALK